MKRPIVIASALLVLFCAAGQAKASSITYTVTDIAAGSLGGTNFRDVLVTITLVSDTSTVFLNAPGDWENAGTATVTVSGLPTATFTDVMLAFDNQANTAAGIFDSTLTGTVLDTQDPASFAAYDLKSAIGPVTNTELFLRTDLNFATTAGALHFDFAGDSTFTATTNTAPEPGVLLLLSSALGCLLIAARRRRTKQYPLPVH